MEDEDETERLNTSKKDTRLLADREFKNSTGPKRMNADLIS